MAALQPSDSDLATRDLVRAALLTDREAMDRSIAMLHDLAETEAESEPDLVRRIPISLDLRNATLVNVVESCTCVCPNVGNRAASPLINQLGFSCA